MIQNARFLSSKKGWRPRRSGRHGRRAGAEGGACSAIWTALLLAIATGASLAARGGGGQCPGSRRKSRDHPPIWEPRPAMSSRSTPIAQRLDEQGKSGRLLPAAWIIKVIAGKWRAPAGKHPNELPGIELGPNIIFRQIGDAVALYRSGARQRYVVD